MFIIYDILIEFIFFIAKLFMSQKADSDPLWQGRFGQIESSSNVDIWIHAASVGEVKVIGHLISYLQSQKPKIKIHVTTMTRSGYQTATKLYGSKNLTITLFPFDTKKMEAITFEKINPKVLAIAETEIWPNFILEADKRNIPIVLINGRMSAKAFKKYKFFKKSFSTLLMKYRKLFLKSKEDFDRYLNFTREEQLHIAGDMKFDAPLIERTKEKVDGIRIACGIEPESFLLVAGSTRPGEEELLADMFLKIIKTHKNFNLIIAPRHIDRVSEIRNILQKKNIQFKLYGSSSKHDSVILVDKVGILQNLYLAADLAFVGGTFVDIGGHNILEPVWAGVPVIFGMSTFNINESVDYVLENNYGIQVKDADELYQNVLYKINNELTLNIKKSNDLEKSATRQIGDFLLEMI